jgi:hypothetical protein
VIQQHQAFTEQPPKAEPVEIDRYPEQQPTQPRGRLNVLNYLHDYLITFLSL